MKTTLIAVLAALILTTLAAGAYAAGTTYLGQQCPGYPNAIRSDACGSSHTPGYNRSPVPTEVNGPCGAGPACACVDPWIACGTFCQAGQLAAGWPYGWRDEYWLRPDSNF